MSSSVVIINSSVAELNDLYIKAISATFAAALSIDTADVIVTSSRSPYRRLLDLNVIIADITTSMRYASAARVLSTSRNDLANMNRTMINAGLRLFLDSYVSSGNATAQFRRDLTLLGVDYYEHIAIVGVMDQTEVQQTEVVSTASNVFVVTLFEAVVAIVFLVVLCIVAAYYVFYVRYKRGKEERSADLNIGELYENKSVTDSEKGALEDKESDALKAVYTDFLHHHKYFDAVYASCSDRVSESGNIMRPRSMLLMNPNLVDSRDCADTETKFMEELEEGRSVSPLSMDLDPSSDGEGAVVGEEEGNASPDSMGDEEFIFQEVDEGAEIDDELKVDLEEEVEEEEEAEVKAEEVDEAGVSVSVSASTEGELLRSACTRSGDESICWYDVYDIKRQKSDLDIFSTSALSELGKNLDSDNEGITPEADMFGDGDNRSSITGSNFHSPRTPSTKFTSAVDNTYSNPLRSSSRSKASIDDFGRPKNGGLFPEHPIVASMNAGLRSNMLKSRSYHNADQANPLMGGSRTNNQITSSIKFRATKLIFESLINENSKSSCSPGSDGFRPDHAHVRAIRRQPSGPYSNASYMSYQMRRTPTSEEKEGRERRLSGVFPDSPDRGDINVNRSLSTSAMSTGASANTISSAMGKRSISGGNIRHDTTEQTFS